LGGLSAFRPCGRDVVEFFNGTVWAFPVNLTKVDFTSGSAKLPRTPSIENHDKRGDSLIILCGTDRV
jgi:hypothetical protein